MPRVSGRVIYKGIRILMCTWRYTWYTPVEVYVVYTCGVIRCIRLWRYTWRYTGYTQVEVYLKVCGVYVGGGIREGIRDIPMMEDARGIRWWRYTGYAPVGDHHMRY